MLVVHLVQGVWVVEQYAGEPCVRLLTCRVMYDAALCVAIRRESRQEDEKKYTVQEKSKKVSEMTRRSFSKQRKLVL